MLTHIVAAVTCIGAVLGGLLGLAYQVPADRMNDPLYAAIPLVSYLSLALGVIGILILLYLWARQAQAKAVGPSRRVADAVMTVVRTLRRIRLVVLPDDPSEHTLHDIPREPVFTVRGWGQGGVEVLETDDSTAPNTDREIARIRPAERAVWPPALRSVPKAFRATRVQDFRASWLNALTLGKNLRARLWSLNLYQLQKQRPALESQEAGFKKAVSDHKRNWWSQGEPGEFDLEAKVQPIDPKAQVPWQAEMSARIEAELKWLKDHHEPGQPG